MAKAKTTAAKTKPGPKPAGLVALNLRLAGDLIAALDEVVEERRAASPFVPLTRTDVVRDAIIRVVEESRAARADAAPETPPPGSPQATHAEPLMERPPLPALTGAAKPRRR